MPTLPDMRLAEHRRAGSDRLDDHVGAAFHPRRHEQQVRALDRLPRPRVRAGPEPLHAGIDGGQVARRAAERRIERRADDRQRRVDARRPGAATRRRRWRDPFRRAGGRPARNAGDPRACAATARARAPTGTRRAPCRAARRARAAGASSCSTISRSASVIDASVAASPAGQVAIEVGAGERDDERPVRVRACATRRSRRWLRRACSATMTSAAAPRPSPIAADAACTMTR